MHKRLLNITTHCSQRLSRFAIHPKLSGIQTISMKLPTRYYGENPKLNNNPQPVKEDNFEKNKEDLNTYIQSPETSSKSVEQESSSTTPTNEREKIKKLRQKIKKRETEDPLGITTVTKKKSMLDHIKETFANIKKSLKDLYKDGKYVYNLKKQHGSWKNLHLVEYIKYKNINYDLIKFLPYSLFLTIPIAEFALPFYILLFPNSTPSQFYSEKKVGERTQKMNLKQKEGFEVIKKKLYTTFGNDFLEIEQKCKVLRENPGDKDAKKMLIKLDAKIQEKLKEEWANYYSKHLSFYKLTIEEQEAILKVFYIEYISGTYIINQLYNIPFMIYNFLSKYIKTSKVEINEEKWKLNFFPILHLKIISFRIQLLRHLQRIKKEDRLLFKDVDDELNRCSAIELFELIRKRGFKIESDTDRKEFLKTYWPQHAEIKKTDVKVWSILLRHYYGDYLI